jgi:hypothetical protein
MTSVPARFQRAGSSRVVGCLVYLVVAPFVALLLAIFLTLPITFALEALGVPRERSGEALLVTLPLVGIGVAAWGYRDYRRRAALEVVVDRDLVTLVVNSRPRVLKFEEVASIRLVPTRLDFACVLAPRSGRVLRLPIEVAPFKLVRESLDVTLIPRLASRLEERIAGGEATTLRISYLRILMTALRATGAMLMGVLMLVNPWWFAMGILFVNHAIIVMRQSWLGFRGGVVLERDGVRRLSDAPATLTGWNHLEQIQADPIGLVLRSTSGQVFALSALTDDFWPALRWINSRLRKVGSRVDRSPDSPDPKDDAAKGQA